jgi:hypothetical protein
MESYSGIFHELPNHFFYYTAKKFLQAAYSPRVANSFYSFTINRKQSAHSGKVHVECFNGGAFVQLHISVHNIVRKGDYAKHKFVNGADIVKTALVNIQTIPKYYYVTFQEGMSTEERCVPDIDAAKKRVIAKWNREHSTSPIAEPVNWYIKEV